MVKCNVCKSENEDGAIYCGQCGTYLGSKKICGSCNKEIDGDSVVCCYCGSVQKENILKKINDLKSLLIEDTNNHENNLNESLSESEFYNRLADVLDSMKNKSPELEAPYLKKVHSIQGGFEIKWKSDHNVDGYNIYIYRDKDGSDPIEHRQIFDVDKCKALYSPNKKGKTYYVAVSIFKIIDNVVYESDLSKIRKIKK